MREGAQKDVFPFMLKKKMEIESKKLKKIMIFDVLVPEMKKLLFVCLQYNTQM